MNNEKKYSAFISYRHLPLDESVAVRVQNMLESYRQPRGVAAGKRIGRIFRVADGELVYRMTPNGTNNYAEISVTTDEENQRLYIQFFSSYPETRCISTAAWEELGAPEYAAAFLPETGELLCMDYQHLYLMGYQHLYLVKVPSRDELMETAARFVEMSRTHT